MGWSMPDEREKFTLDEMLEVFDIQRISLGGPVFDVEKLSKCILDRTWPNLGAKKAEHDPKLEPKSFPKGTQNCMQKMSGIASLANHFNKKINHTNCKILDTRKTTPGFRYPEKWAVSIGGGYNHRMGLFDAIMVKDNHVDFCGGMEKALIKIKCYLDKNQFNILYSHNLGDTV